ncbi:hypothetical protein HYZ41_02735 [archaeon]|nr:hypothetical protein [archaeon]
MKKMLWGTENDNEFHAYDITNRDRMFIENGKVFFEYYSFDREDTRQYLYNGEFDIKDYINALKELQETGNAEISCSNYTLRIRKVNEAVELKFFGAPNPSSTPGGSMLHGCVTSRQKIDKLLPNDLQVSKEFVVEGEEIVYDAFDDFECRNPMKSITIQASSINDAENRGRKIFQDEIDEYRKKGDFMHSGTFIAHIIKVSEKNNVSENV